MVVVETVRDVACAAVAWEHRGARYATIVCKATYAIVPDRPMRLVTATALRAEDAVDANGRVIGPAELAVFKPQIDFLITPPDGHSEPLRVGVFRAGELVFHKVGAPSPLAPRLANVKRADHRAMLARPTPVIPPDFDWLTLQTAPADQRLEQIADGDWIAVEGAWPGGAVLRMKLAIPITVAEAPIGATPLRADTVHLDLERKRCDVVMRGRFELTTSDLTVFVQFLAQQPSAARVQPLSEPPAMPSVPSIPSTLRGQTVTTQIDVSALSARTPFDQKSMAKQNRSRPPPSSAPPAETGALIETAQVDQKALRAELMPFARAKASRPASTPPAPPIPGAPWSSVESPAVKPADPQGPPKTLEEGLPTPGRAPPTPPPLEEAEPIRLTEPPAAPLAPPAPPPPAAPPPAAPPPAAPPPAAPPPAAPPPAAPPPAAPPPAAPPPVAPSEPAGPRPAAEAPWSAIASYRPGGAVEGDARPEAATSSNPKPQAAPAAPPEVKSKIYGTFKK